MKPIDIFIKFLRKSVKKDGFIINYDGDKYIVGQPLSQKPIEVCLNKKNLPLKLILCPDLYFGEAYVNSDIVIKNGNISDFFEIYMSNISNEDLSIRESLVKSLAPMCSWLFGRINTIGRSKKNVSHHYDLSNDLYELFLDKKMQYSCGYFLNGDESIDEAQQNKINHIIRKLNISPGMKVLDIGSGWGGLSIEIAKKTDALITGITLSDNQLKYSLKKASEEGVSDQCTFRLEDYRNIVEKYDRIVSVGMFEHVGVGFYKTFFDKIHSALTNDGVALLHTIGNLSKPRSVVPWITKYIFPGGYIPSLSEISPCIQNSNLLTNDIEILRNHYAKTLNLWKKKFFLNKDKLNNKFDDKFIRMWDYYLTSCEMGFKYRDTCVFQIILSKKLHTLPYTRDYLYK